MPGSTAAGGAFDYVACLAKHQIITRLCPEKVLRPMTRNCVAQGGLS